MRETCYLAAVIYVSSHSLIQLVDVHVGDLVLMVAELLVAMGR